ncbi:MAG: PAS domain S-box protein [Chlorobiota bacterium]|nr:MAG: PAS domain S-box protein [Chlorobiota bacterium]
MDKLRDQILNSISEAVFTVDKNFRITYFNSAAEELTGYLKEEVINKVCKRVFKPSNCCSKCPMLMVLESKKKVTDYYSDICTSAGETRQVKMSATLLRTDEGEPNGGIISVTPISDIEKLRLELIEGTDFHGIVGRSQKMRDIFNVIRDVASSDSPVFIQGESGTGKEMVANAIQTLSGRRFQPFIKVSCSVFHDNLLASELFGHVKGAFTDAHRDRLMQIKLLRVLQEGTFERLGESVTRKVDVRIIAATNIDIKSALANGSLREDLYYRLNVVPITVPPLRERKEDIPLLVNHFMKKFTTVFKVQEKTIDDEALDILMTYSWPGNIRELENIMEYLFVRSQRETRITASKIPASINSAQPVAQPVHERYLSELLAGANTESDRILKVLQKHRWNRGKAADELGMGRTTLWRKMRLYNIDME